MAFFRPLFTAGIILTSMADAASARADTVSGKVVGPDGKPVAGAKVVVRAFGPTPPFDLTTAKTLTSDGSGEFRIDAVPPVRPKEGNPTVARAFVSMPGFGLAQAFLTLHPSENNTIRLEKSTTLSGKLVDTAGKPVAGAGVQLVHFSLRSPQPDDGANSFWLENDDIPKSLLTAKTDADGIWTLSGLPGKAAEAGVRLTDGKFLQSVVMFPVPASGLTKTLVAHPAATLTGRVIGRDGKPRPGIHLYTRSEDFRGGSTTATTDANGVYQLAGLPTGSFVVLVTDDATSYLTGAPPEEIALPLRGLLLTEGKETTAPDLVMMPGGLVEGAVLDAVDNRPVTEAVIMVLDTIGIRVAYSGSVAGAEGRFKLRLPPGRFRLAIPSRPEGYLNELESGEAAMVDVVVTEGGTVPAVFRLPRSKTVSGLAQDVNGSPVPAVSIG